MAYASGKYSYGLCDYCGQRYPFKILRKNWRGFKVCPSDYEPKEPQLEPLKYRGDAIALLEPRPDRVEPVDVYVGQPGYTYFQSIGSANNVINMRPYPSQDTPFGVGGVGQVLVVTGIPVIASGVEASGGVGSVVVPNISFPVSGISGAGSVEPVSVTSNSVLVDVSGVFASSGVGTVGLPNVSFTPSSIDGTGEVGDPSVTTT
jgi:hypothetical protein